MSRYGPNPQDLHHYSNLDHVRHLLAKDPTLQQLNMQGGLNTWFYANVQKILAWAIAAKTGQQQTLAYKIDTELSKINTRLQQVQHDAKQLVGMSNTQLATPAAASLLTDLLGNANSAYVGELDPTTDTRQGGAIWIHDVMPQIASLDLRSLQGWCRS